jgi:hypothetical protein
MDCTLRLPGYPLPFVPREDKRTGVRPLRRASRAATR